MSSLPALLLHQGGWDEMLMVAAALGIAYLIIVWSGRGKSDDELDEEDEERGDVDLDGEAADDARVSGSDTPRSADASRDRTAPPPS